MIYINSFSNIREQIGNRLIKDFQFLDFTLLSFSYNDTKSIYVATDENEYSLLLSKNIKQGYIIPYYIFKDSTFDNPLSNFIQGRQYDGIFIGMSHSQCSIDVSKLKTNWLMMARPSADLFCHLKYLQKVYREIPNPSIVKNIILEIPYYIFNYDLSSFGNFVYTKLNYFVELDQYHNFLKRTDSLERIDQFKNYISCFREGSPDKVEPSKIKKIALKLGVGKLIDLYRVVKNKDVVWQKNYEDTINENELIFKNLISFVVSKFSNARLIILIMPFNPVFRYSHIKYCKKTELLFYRIVKKYNLKVIDNFSLYNNPLLFADHCHLNKLGGIKYTNYLSEQLDKLL